MTCKVITQESIETSWVVFILIFFYIAGGQWFTLNAPCEADILIPEVRCITYDCVGSWQSQRWPQTMNGGDGIGRCKQGCTPIMYYVIPCHSWFESLLYRHMGNNNGSVKNGDTTVLDIDDQQKTANNQCQICRSHHTRLRVCLARSYPQP